MRVLTLLYFLSGFSGLLLEVVWARRLTFLFGNGVRAAGAVTALTLAGLALGSRWAGRRADRRRRPLAVYAVLEAGIALWAFATPFLFRLISWSAASVPDRWGGGIDLGPVALLATALLLLPGTVLMGATAPFMVRAALARGASAGGHSAGEILGTLYGWNTAGGALGACLAVFLVLPALGLGRTIMLAGALEILVASWARALEFPPGVQETVMRGLDEGTRSEASPSRTVLRGISLGALAAAGALAAGSQIVWTRILILLLGSSVHAFALALSAYLAGLAAGSAWAGRRLRRGRDPWRLAISSLLAAAVLTLILVSGLGRLPALLALTLERLTPAFPSVLLIQALLALIVILPPAVALGALLPALTASLSGSPERAGRDSGDGYSLDTWGSVLGCLASTFFLLPLLGSEKLLRAGALGEAGLAIALWRASPIALPRQLKHLAFGLILLLPAAVFLPPRWDRELMTSGPLLYARAYAGGSRRNAPQVEEAIRRRGKLRFFDEGPEATVTVRQGIGGILSLQINGKTDASTGGDLPSQILAGQLPALLHPGPRTALIIGLATGVTAGAVATHSLERMDCVEISPGVIRAAPLFSAASRNVLTDPRLRLHHGDGRAYLNRTRQRFDLIASQPTNPWISGVTNLFTREFFLLARDRLSPGGVLCVWVQGYALQPEDFRGLLRTFAGVFPDALLWEESPAGGDYFLVGRRGGTWPSLDEMAARLGQSMAVREDLARAGVPDEAALLSRLVTGPRGLAFLSRHALRVTDDNLRLEYRAPRALWEEHAAELTSALERTRESALALFQGSEPLRVDLGPRLARAESLRRERIRMALTLRRPDWEALASPSLSTAVALLRAGRRDAALPFLRRAGNEAPRAPAIHLLEGWLLLDQGEAESAADAFQEAFRLDPGSAEALNGLGVIAWRGRDMDSAEAIFRRARSLDPLNPDIGNNLASVLLSRGREAEALPILDAVIREDPSHVPARVNRGLILARQGRLDEAIAEYLRALELDPLNPDAAYNLSRARARGKEEGNSGPRGPGGRSLGSGRR